MVWIEDAPGVILEGFQIEGAGTVGVWIGPDSPGATVRNTVFEDCVFALVLPAESLVEWTEYRYAGFYEFADELIELTGSVSSVCELVKEYPPTVRYEGGLALSHTWMGEPTRDCEFRYNYLHETFDGEKLGYFSSSQSHPHWFRIHESRPRTPASIALTL